MNAHTHLPVLPRAECHVFRVYGVHTVLGVHMKSTDHTVCCVLTVCCVSTVLSVPCVEWGRWGRQGAGQTTQRVLTRDEGQMEGDGGGDGEVCAKGRGDETYGELLKEKKGVAMKAM